MACRCGTVPRQRRCSAVVGWPLRRQVVEARHTRRLGTDRHKRKHSADLDRMQCSRCIRRSHRLLGIQCIWSAHIPQTFPTDPKCTHTGAGIHGLLTSLRCKGRLSVTFACNASRRRRMRCFGSLRRRHSWLRTSLQCSSHIGRSCRRRWAGMSCPCRRIWRLRRRQSSYRRMSRS